MKSIFTFYLCVNSPLNHLTNIRRVGNPPNFWGFGFLQKSAQKKRTNPWIVDSCFLLRIFGLWIADSSNIFKVLSLNKKF